jgi:hypothetical protein
MPKNCRVAEVLRSLAYDVTRRVNQEDDTRDILEMVENKVHFIKNPPAGVNMKW